MSKYSGKLCCKFSLFQKLELSKYTVPYFQNYVKGENTKLTITIMTLSSVRSPWPLVATVAAFLLFIAAFALKSRMYWRPEHR